MCPTIVAGIESGEALVNHWPLVSLRNRTAGREDGKNAFQKVEFDRPAERFCMTNVIAISCEFWSWCYLNINIFLSLQNDPFKGKWSLVKSYFFQNYCHAWHTRLAVFVPFPSCCVSSLPSTNTRGLCELGPVPSRFVSVEWYLNWSPKIREFFSMQPHSSSGSKRLINYCIHRPNWLTQDPL